MEFDIEMGDVDNVGYVARLPETYTEDIITGEEQEPGEVDEDAAGNADSTEAELKHIVPNKIHVRGLDTFAPNDVKAYVAQHQAGQFERVEWIDDTSANLVYPSESGAQEALVKLAAVPIADVTQLPPLESIPAKEYASKPDSVLQVRFAVAGDKKAANAAARSRFYLLHPEHDPEERRRRGEFDRKRYRDRDGDYSRDQRRDGNRRRPRFDYDDEEKQFDVTLYDDNAETRSGPRAVSRSRQRSDSVSTRSSESDRVRFQADKNRNKELFPNWQSRKARSRDRSASPTRSYGRGNHEADLDESTRAAAAARTREKARAIKERLSRENKSRELFPGKDVKAKELFPSMVGSSSGGRAQMDQVEDSSILTSAKLVTTREASASGTSIRGAANRRGLDQGFAIKGTANVKELFPDRFGSVGNTGKELFADKLNNTRQRRQRAEDSFY